MPFQTFLSIEDRVYEVMRLDDFKLLTTITTQLATQILLFVAITKIDLSVFTFCWIITYLTFFNFLYNLLLGICQTIRSH